MRAVRSVDELDAIARAAEQRMAAPIPLRPERREPVDGGPPLDDEPYDDTDRTPYADDPTDDEIRQARLDYRPIDDLRKQLGVRPLGDISSDPPPPLLADRIDGRGHTILYGTGASGKGSAEPVNRSETPASGD